MIQKILHWMDWFLRPVVAISTILYLTEISLGGRDSYESPVFFLWAERVVALIFTVEYALRWYDDAVDNYGWHYPHSWLGFVDLISILPFWIGFFVPVQWLHVIRTFRVFRLLKFFRYSRSLQLVALGFFRAWHSLRALGFSVMIIGMFCMVAMYEIEKDAQPEKLANLFDAFYFTAVTITTVGYGDISPVTPVGRVVSMMCFFFALSVFAGILGVLGNSFVKVLEEEADPNVDPIQLFKEERIRQLELAVANRKFGPSYHREKHD